MKIETKTFWRLVRQSSLILTLLCEHSTVVFAQSLAAGVPTDEMSESVLTREPTQGQIRILNIEGDFTLPRTAVPFFARLYYFPQKPSEIEYRDIIIAEDKYEEESKRPSSFYFILKQTNTLAPPYGYNLVQAPGTLVNITAQKGFDLKRGGNLNLYIKVAFQNPILLKIFTDRRGDKLRTFLIQDDGQMILFDQILIEARKLWGRPNILRGIEGIKFMRNGKTVSQI